MLAEIYRLNVLHFELYVDTRDGAKMGELHYSSMKLSQASQRITSPWQSKCIS